MAFNDIILNDRNNVLSKLFSNIAKSNFKEDKIFLENSIINFDIEEERIKKSLNTNSKIKQLDKNDFLNLKSFIDFKLTKIKVSTQTHDRQPGDIISINKKSLQVSCGNGTVVDVTELQPQGKKPMTPYCYCLGNKLPDCLA